MSFLGLVFFFTVKFYQWTLWSISTSLPGKDIIKKEDGVYTGEVGARMK